MPVIIGVDGNVNVPNAEGAGFDYGLESDRIELERLRSAFCFARACAAMAKVPNAEQWRLVHDVTRVFAWRVTDSDETASLKDDWSTGNVVFALSNDPKVVRVELNTYGRALRGMAELAIRGHSIDLMSPNGRQAVQGKGER